MDTGGYNEKLINHYKKCGFSYLGLSKLKNPEGLPQHYKDTEICFFEISL